LDGAARLADATAVGRWLEGSEVCATRDEGEPIKNASNYE
jgi:hypothetical protein